MLWEEHVVVDKHASLSSWTLLHHLLNVVSIFDRLVELGVLLVYEFRRRMEQADALLAEGQFYSDLELTEQEIKRMVMEASRAKYLAEEDHRVLLSMGFSHFRIRHLSEETSSSAAGGPPSSGVLRASESTGGSHVGGSVSLTYSAVINRSSNVCVLLSMGFSYFRVMEACNIFRTT
ncbi:hypothetical protein SELMODRAFT_417594 [Selaginella moellendorffii]|uniref:Uncharacterized protein n=1 Tax=Selaginella moellendorffii TaxID=88036 RepID=D8S2Y8_SELML|nr:hypothetical protein SELMODRAFT_417594 [Selaginella moellendorffii]